MRVALVTSGTRGDAQPMILLARELRERGHEPVLGLPPQVATLGEQAGIVTHPLGPETQTLVDSEQGQRWLARGEGQAFTEELGRRSLGAFDATAQAVRRACEGVDLVVTGAQVQDVALPVAEARGVPVVALHSHPVEPNRCYPHLSLTTARLPGPLNLISGRVAERRRWEGVRDHVNRFRAELGLQPADRSSSRQMERDGQVAMQAYDPALVPGLEASYGARRPFVGTLAPDGGLRQALHEDVLAPGLTEWLDAGDPPAFVGLGSLPVRDPAGALALVREVTGRLGLRAVVNADWPGLPRPDDDPDLLVVGTVDHDVLLRRCRVAVHHGGAGTTYASLAAGVPTVICSVFADQPFWGARLEQLGVGATLRYAHLGPDRLETAVRRALVPAVTRAAEDLGRLLRSRPSGTARAADVVVAAAPA